MMLYATIDELRENTGVDAARIGDAQAARLLRTACAVLRKRTRACVYDTDSDGMPKDKRLRSAFHDAALTLCSIWVDANILEQILDSGASTPASVKATSDNGASVTFDDSEAASARRFLLNGGVPAAVDDCLLPVLACEGQPVITW